MLEGEILQNYNKEKQPLIDVSTIEVQKKEKQIKILYYNKFIFLDS